jgi:ATP-dependent exoDNAse (exonuclease V) alpha subunit
LREGAGIESTSVAALLQDVRLDSRRGLPAGAVLVVDEAGMVPTRDLAALLITSSTPAGSWCWSGTTASYPSSRQAASSAAWVQRRLAIELRDNVRQVHRWERQPLDELRDGRAEEALARYGAHGRISVNADEEQTRRALVGDWLAAGEGEAVMIAHRRADVTELNRLAREQRRRCARLGEFELSLPGGDFAVGDLVVVKRNDRRLGVNNGFAVASRPWISRQGG